MIKTDGKGNSGHRNSICNDALQAAFISLSVMLHAPE